MKLFVYGSLKRGFSNHHFLAGQEFLGEARTVPRFRMFDCGGFPGVVDAGSDGAYQIQGELWQIDSACLRRIDWLEEIDTGVCTMIECEVDAGQGPEPAHLYLYKRALGAGLEAGSTWPKSLDALPPSQIPWD